MKKVALGIAPCLMLVLAGLSSSLSRASEVVWSDDAVPAGAVELAGAVDTWNWVSSDPAPFSGNLAHQSALAAGLHEHFFNYASTRLLVGQNDTLFAYVYLNPTNPPSEIMLSWNADNWEHRAYWGANEINYGTDNTVSRQYMGPLPAAGQWVRLAVPASSVGLQGLTLSGMGFSTFDGQVTYDYEGADSQDVASGASAAPAGSSVASTGASTTSTTTTSTSPSSSSTTAATGTTNTSTTSTAPTSTTSTTGSSSTLTTSTTSSTSSGTTANTVWVDDAVPAGAQALPGTGGEGWSWISSSPAPYSGTLAHQSILAAGLHEHFFNFATTTITPGAADVLYTYVYLDPANPPSEIMLSWNADNWEHRAYWGADDITYGSDGTVSRVNMGVLPATGQWIRLAVPASSVGLVGQTLTGMDFACYNGQVTWDCSGVDTPAPASTSATSGGTGTSSSAGTDVTWFDSAIPAGAQAMVNNDAWNWVSSDPAPYTGSLCFQSNIVGGLHELYFNYASTTMAVATGQNLFTYVYLDPANPPTEIMLSWNADNWEHRAFWGADEINYGTSGSASRYNMGAIPAAGGWVRLSIPASAVGLEGQSVSGMCFSLYGGRAAWDHSGVTQGATSSSSTSGTTSSSGSTGTSGSGTTTTTTTGSTGSGSTGTTTTGSSGGSSGGTTAVGVISGATGTDAANRTADSIASGDNVDDTNLQLPAVGSNLLHILSPNLLELVNINTKQPDPAQVATWNFVNSSGAAAEPGPGEFTVTVGGQTVAVTAVGFKRRVLYAPLNSYDLRVENNLFLQLASPVASGQLVTVTNSDQSLWPSSTLYQALCDPLRYSPAIHVNQEGYVPEFSKRAMIGYYLGDMGEMPISAGAGFNLVNATTGQVAYSGTLTVRPDQGYDTTPVPYQQVYVADFSSFTTPGQYQLQVPGLGASLPFLIDDGIAMAWARTYSLGMYEQRSGMAVAMPYTRFTHAADHTAPASIPVPDTSAQFSFTWNCVSGYATTVNTNNPAQTAPFLTNNETSLYPYVNTGAVDVSGGHFDAGDYSKYTINSAQLIHELVFAVDNIPGTQQFDNLGIPESGDGIPDVLQEAKWEADFLAKMQDADGGFYFLVYPIDREYESNVLPENGDPQVVWPKNTSATAASVAALAEAGSSPVMKKYYPAAAALYLQKAQLGWQFLMNAINKYGKAGAYQKITFYGDDWTHDDELAWAASAMYAATGNTQYQTQLFSWFPNPADSSTFRWGWWRMAECWGNAIRTYAFAAKSGRLLASALDANYLAACDAQIVAAGDDAVTWSNDCAYGTPFPPATKAVLGGGWYFSLDQASDMAVAYQIDPKPQYIDGLVSAMNYEGGANPANVCYLEGLGIKRQHQVVSQYAQNSRRVLAPSGFVLGQVTAAFEYLSQYGPELSELSYPTDGGSTNTFPYYDRWSDAYNVTTEQITVNLARSLISTGFLASLTSSASTAWTAPTATISLPAGTAQLGSPVTMSVTVNGQSLNNARVVWEARDQQPAYGATAAFTPVNNGDQWVEAEVEWPDGRRAFATGDYTANSSNQVWIDDALPTGANPTTAWNWVSSSPAPHTGSLAAQTAVATGEHDLTFTGATGAMQVETGDTLYAWVYLDPANPPTEVMVCWNDGSSWEHRAYWGANQISWGTNGTAGCYNVGALPATGQWVQLSVPASAVNLQGDSVSGMTLAVFGGRATFDTIGRAAAGGN